MDAGHVIEWGLNSLRYADATSKEKRERAECGCGWFVPRVRWSLHHSWGPQTISVLLGSEAATSITDRLTRTSGGFLRWQRADTNEQETGVLHRIGLISVLLWPVPVSAADWPHWRGPERSGVTSDPSGWDGTSWIADEAWEISVGEGSSSPVVVDDRVYFTGWSDGLDSITCVRLDDGQLLWRQFAPAPRYGRFAVGDQGLYSGACSTPEYDPDTGLLFTLSIDGDLIAWDTKDQGKRHWGINLYDEFGGERRPDVATRRKTQRDYGYTTSPLVQGEQLIVEVGGRTGNLVALNKRDGRVLWSGENRDEAGHSGGLVPITVEGTPCVAVLTLRNLVVTSIHPDSAGRTVAEVPWTTDFGNNIPTPVVYEESVIVTSSYNRSAMCRVKIDLRGATKVWETEETHSAVCSPVVHNGYLYWAWRGVHCVDLDTGRERWSGGNVEAPGSCIVTGDGRLVVYANKGDLTLVETADRSPDAYRELAAEQVLTTTDAWPHVVVVGDRILCRDRSGAVRCLRTHAASSAKVGVLPKSTRGN